MKNILGRFVKKIKTHILCPITFYRKIVSFVR